MWTKKNAKRKQRKKQQRERQEMMEKEQRECDKIKFPDKDMTQAEFEEFVVKHFIRSLKPQDKQYISEHTDPMDYYFGTCFYIMNYYISNYQMKGHTLTDVDADYQNYSDHFREHFSVELMEKIIKAVCEEMAATKDC